MSKFSKLVILALNLLFLFVQIVIELGYLTGLTVIYTGGEKEYFWLSTYEFGVPIIFTITICHLFCGLSGLKSFNNL